MQTQVVVINGSGGVGKDTFVECVRKAMRVFCGGTCVNYSSVDKACEYARTMGWDGTKTEKNRKFLSDLKRVLDEWGDVSFRAMSDKLSEVRACDNPPAIVFLHIREPHNIERAVREFGARTLLVTNPNVAAISSNPSDASVNEYAGYNFVVDNDGTLDDLQQKANDFVSILDMICDGDVSE